MMPTEPGRRRKRSSTLSFVIIPEADGGRTRRFRVKILTIWMAAVTLVCTIAALTVVVLLYTPVAHYVPLKSPELEKKYSHQAAETQRMLMQLTQDVMVLKDYNQQLRKALGERHDSTVSTSSSWTIALSPQAGVREPADQTSEQMPTDAIPAEMISEGYGEFMNDYEFHPVFPVLTPSEGYVTQRFDPARKHYGIDFATSSGSPVYAGTDGYVVFSGWTVDDGNMMILSHGRGYMTVYKHNKVLAKGVLEYAKRGELIALAGSTGRTSLGPHVHFEVWKDGIPQDPDDYLLNESINKQ